MKKGILMLLSINLFIGAFCQEKTELEQAKKAIINTLYEEGKRFTAYDMDGISALHITDESATRYDGSKVYYGWDNIEPLYQFYIERNKGFNDENVRNEKENTITKVTGDNAWVICDNIWKWEIEGETHSAKNFQIAFLEKSDGEWKFAFNAFVADPDPIDLDAAKSKVSLLVDKYNKAMKEMDLDLLKSVLAEEGMFLGTDPTEIFDKETLLGLWEPAFQEPVQGIEFRSDMREISLSSNGRSAMVVEQISGISWSPNMPAG